MIIAKAKLVVVARSCVERWFVVWDQAKTRAAFFQPEFQRNTGFLNVTCGDREAVGTNTKSDFAYMPAPGFAVGFDNGLAHMFPITEEFTDDESCLLATTEALCILVVIIYHARFSCVPVWKRYSSLVVYLYGEDENIV